ncbi:leucine-rich repeat-containing protein 37A3-like isoform X2 [Pipra filicauda]|uniref:Leucine-rich repeat-containing protein 37A3-like isoform X2 n=1 Tax=Pipra filicauda TaxID=649802 RepID=A0A7R5KHM2_9PASS|nr:leucine-rich repeat-containing protein 37A3-like isoform X2 [Pipra filicauda]
MDLLTRVVRALFLLALLLAVTPCPGESKELCPHPCRCQRRGLLDCRHAGLATVPPATRRRALTVLDFTGNSIATLDEQTWKEYPWTETLVLRDNELQAVKSHSLEGLFLLKHLDLSANRILLIEEGAFEPLPFLRLLNLSGNGLTQIHSSTFQAWHGMQFLEELILSHNPLTVIADTAFFKLPSVNYLDLSATQVTPQTLLLLLQTTVHLETLKLPKDVACCLCQEHASTETPCRTIQFLCENLCSSSSAQCAAHTGPVAQTQGEVMEVEPSGKAKSSPVLNLRAKQPSLGDHGTVTLGVALTLSSTEGDVSSLKDSRSDSYPPEHLSRQEGKTADDELMLEVKNNLHKAKSIMTVKSIVSRQPQPVREKDVEEKSITVWERKQKGSHLNWQALNPWDEAGGLNPSEDYSEHHKVSTLPSKQSPSHSTAKGRRFSRSVNILNYYNAVEQTQNTIGMEDVEDREEEEEAPSSKQNYGWTQKQHNKKASQQKQRDSHLNWQALNPWDGAGGLNPTDEDSVSGHHKDVDVAPSPIRKYIWKKKEHKKTNSQYWVGQNPLFYQVLGPAKAQGEPTGRESKAQLGLNRNLDFLSDPLVNNGPAAISRVEDRAEGEPSSRGEDFETTVDRSLRLLVPDEGLRMFLAHMERALRTDCSLPGLQLACAKMVSKTGLLLNLLSKRQESEGASAFMRQCLLQENISRRTALEEGKEHRGEKAMKHSQERFQFAILVLIFYITYFILHCLIETCSEPHEDDFQPQCRRKSLLRRFFKIPCRRGRKKEYKAKSLEQVRAGSTFQCCPSAHTACSSSPLPIIPLHGAFQHLPVSHHFKVKPRVFPAS